MDGTVFDPTPAIRHPRRVRLPRSSGSCWRQALRAGLAAGCLAALAGCGGDEAGAPAQPLQAATARPAPESGAADVLEVRVECCGEAAVDQAVGIAWGVQAARDLPDDTPVLVHAADARLAAAAAERLAAGGMTRVRQVTP